MRLSTKISLAGELSVSVFSDFFFVAFGRYADRYGGSYQTAGVGPSGEERRRNLVHDWQDRVL